MSHRYFEIIVTGRQLALLIGLVAALVLVAFGLGVGVGIQQVSPTRPEERGSGLVVSGQAAVASSVPREDHGQWTGEAGRSTPPVSASPTGSSTGGEGVAGAAPPTPLPTRAPRPPEAASRGRFVQVAALSHAGAAEGVRQRVVALGFRPAQATVHEVAGKYRVRLGPFPDEESARRVAARLRAEGFPGAFVVGPGE